MAQIIISESSKMFITDRKLLFFGAALHQFNVFNEIWSLQIVEQYVSLDLTNDK